VIKDKVEEIKKKRAFDKTSGYRRDEKKRGEIMPRRLGKEQARHFLRAVSPERAFWVNNGHVLNTLAELSGELKIIGQETFEHHVNKEKNDFENWIRNVVGDLKLAKDISKIKTSKAALKKVDARIRYLEKVGR
jgi:hypothetical protein